MTIGPRISIVIPCFNHGSLLLETLASIDRVRIDSVAEVIIVNDGSTDPTTCRVFRELDSVKYRIIHQENRGLSAARNAGITAAKGEFILPVDSDNFIRRTYLDKGLAVLLSEPDIGVVYGDLQFFGEATGRHRQRDFEWASFVRKNYIDACALYRKSVWESVRGYDEKMRIGWEDWDFWMRSALHGWRFHHLDEIAFDYRVRIGSMLSETEKHKIELAEYIFSKPGFELLRPLRDQAIQLEEMSKNFQSLDYRVGRAIVAPLRKVTRIPSGIRRRLRERAAAREQA